MDIHKPKPWHGLREFLKEYAIIFIGVLTALGAEQTVEALHWRHKVEQTEEVLRLELLDDNAPQAFVRMAVDRCFDGALGAISGAVAKDADRKTVQGLIARYQPRSYSWDAEAWHVILASDVGSHTSAQKMILWSAPYRSIPMLSAADDRERLGQEAMRLADGPQHLTPDEKERIVSTAYSLRQANDRMAHWSRTYLRALLDLKMEMPADQRRKLVADGRAQLGACVIDPVYATYNPYDQANSRTTPPGR